MKLKYFIEYEFKTDLGNYYWFPIYFTTKNKDEIDKFNQSIIDSIKDQKHQLIRCSKPQLVIEHVNSEYLKDYTEKRMRGRVGIIEVDTWVFIPQTAETTSFESKLDSVELENLCNKDLVAERIKHNEFTIFCYKTNPFLEHTEFLLLNIIDPKQ